MLSRGNETWIETVNRNRSTIETVSGVIEKAKDLKQNREGFCFKRRTLAFLDRAVSRTGPRSFELMWTVSNVAQEKNGGL